MPSPSGALKQRPKVLSARGPRPEGNAQAPELGLSGCICMGGGALTQWLPFRPSVLTGIGRFTLIFYNFLPANSRLEHINTMRQEEASSEVDFTVGCVAALTIELRCN